LLDEVFDIPGAALGGPGYPCIALSSHMLLMREWNEQIAGGGAEVGVAGGEGFRGGDGHWLSVPTSDQVPEEM
jgi:hypothetical protein